MKNRDLTPKEIAEIRLNYPPGTRIHLDQMNDEYMGGKFAVESGTRGTVDYVDSAGQIGMKWDNGRTLALIPQVDSFRKLTQAELLQEQQTAQQQQLANAPTLQMEEQSL